MIKHVAITLCMLMLAGAAWAQTDSLKTKSKKERTVELFGSVYDSFTKAALKAHVTLLKASDSTVVDTMTCWSWGTQSFFQFKVPARQGTLLLKVRARATRTDS